MSDAARRTRLCVASFALAVLGSVLFATLFGIGVFEVRPQGLALWWGPPAVAALCWRAPAQRWVCRLAAVVSGLGALLFLLYGGLFQIPAVVLLCLASRREHHECDRPCP